MPKPKSQADWQAEVAAAEARVVAAETALAAYVAAACQLRDSLDGDRTTIWADINAVVALLDVPDQPNPGETDDG